MFQTSFMKTSFMTKKYYKIIEVTIRYAFANSDPFGNSLVSSLVLAFFGLSFSTVLKTSPNVVGQASPWNQSGMNFQ